MLARYKNWSIISKFCPKKKKVFLTLTLGLRFGEFNESGGFSWIGKNSDVVKGMIRSEI
jgi:hypothetical protein